MNNKEMRLNDFQICSKYIWKTNPFGKNYQIEKLIAWENES